MVLANSSSTMSATIHRLAIYPGSFDPLTNGHLDVIERASNLFDEVVVGVAHNDSKNGTFEIGERVQLIEESLPESLTNVSVVAFHGLLVEYAKKRKAVAVIRGLRAISDFEFEFQMALMNRKLEPTIETMFLMPKEEYTYISSRIVKEIARLGGSVSAFVPVGVEKALKKIFHVPAK